MTSLPLTANSSNLSVRQQMPGLGSFAHSQLPWGPAIALQLGRTEQTWSNLLSGVYHCQADRRTLP